jgi:DNA-binding transcriptional LysR family regulator
MELDWLKDFLALAETGTFSRAADARHVTQPAFSRRIRALETWVGTALFVRGAHGASLTPAGEHFRPRAQALLASLDRARSETRDVGERSEGAVAIAATHTLSFTFFPRWIRTFLDQGAVTGVTLVSDSLEACEEILLAGEVDMLLGHHHPLMPTRLDRADIASAHVGQDRLVAVSAPDAPGAPRWTATGPARLLAYSAASGLGRVLAATPRLQGIYDEGGAVFTSHLAATLQTMARDGHGVAWLPESLIAEDLAAGRLVSAGADALDVGVEIRLFRAADGLRPGALRLWDGVARRDAP